ncbi:hypothetical protein [Enterobacter hormaechei]|uniref:hypothetical protein n=1 Tax=Enterobacter hormaechei TaxID=158836 RepID=UPI003F4288AE
MRTIFALLFLYSFSTYASIGTENIIPYRITDEGINNVLDFAGTFSINRNASIKNIDCKSQVGCNLILVAYTPAHPECKSLGNGYSWGPLAISYYPLYMNNGTDLSFLNKDEIPVSELLNNYRNFKLDYSFSRSGTNASFRAGQVINNFVTDYINTGNAFYSLAIVKNSYEMCPGSNIDGVPIPPLTDKAVCTLELPELTIDFGDLNNSEINGSKQEKNYLVKCTGADADINFSFDGGDSSSSNVTKNIDLGGGIKAQLKTISTQHITKNHEDQEVLYASLSSTSNSTAGKHSGSAVLKINWQ